MGLQQEQHIRERVSKQSIISKVFCCVCWPGSNTGKADIEIAKKPKVNDEALVMAFLEDQDTEGGNPAIN